MGGLPSFEVTATYMEYPGNVGGFTIYWDCLNSQGAYDGHYWRINDNGTYDSSQSTWIPNAVSITPVDDVLLELWY